ncbi:MAG: ABC transporter permease [Pirellulales bacterium]
MTIAARTAVPSAPWLTVWTLCARELVRFFRQRHRVFGALGQPIIFWLLFSEGLRQSNLGYAHFFPGTIVMILLFTAIFATISIIEDRREGFMQGVLVAPIPRWSMMLGKVLGGTVIAMLQGLLFFALGCLTVPDVAPGVVGVIGAVAMMFVIALSLTALGFLLAWRMDSTQGFHAIMMVLLLPMWLLSGAFFPAGGEGVLSWVVTINPLTYGVAGLRHYLEYAQVERVGDGPSLALCWGVSLAFAAVTLWAAWRIAATRSTGDLL